MTVLLPRLSPPAEQALIQLAADGELTPTEARKRTFEAGQGLSWAATGGAQDMTTFWNIGEILRSITRECGFPDRKSDEARRNFDFLATIALAQTSELISGETLRNDVWACLTLVSAPDVALWRFPSAQTERLTGSVRNVFQRLWTRGVALDRDEQAQDRWGLVKALNEDALVQIFERPAVARDRRLARALAEAWLRAAERHGRPAMEDLMREAIKKVRVRNAIQGLGLLDDTELAACLDSFFSTTA